MGGAELSLHTLRALDADFVLPATQPRLASVHSGPRVQARCFGKSCSSSLCSLCSYFLYTGPSASPGVHFRCGNALQIPPNVPWSEGALSEVRIAELYRELLCLCISPWQSCRALSWAFPEAARSMIATAAPAVLPCVARSCASWFVVGLVGCLSIPVVRNMASKKQSMNRTFEPLRIVNTYGAFGSISKVRGCKLLIAEA